MENLTIHQPSDGELELRGVADIYSAVPLREALRKHVRSAAQVRIDLSQVTRCDVVVLQLLLAARRTASETGKALVLTGISRPVADCGAELGLDLDSLTRPNSSLP